MAFRVSRSSSSWDPIVLFPLIDLWSITLPKAPRTWSLKPRGCSRGGAAGGLGSGAGRPSLIFTVSGPRNTMGPHRVPCGTLYWAHSPSKRSLCLF